MASSTRWRVSGLTALPPLATRDTVCADTPASAAMSCMDTDRERSIIAFHCWFRYVFVIIIKDYSANVSCADLPSISLMLE